MDLLEGLAVSKIGSLHGGRKALGTKLAVVRELDSGDLEGLLNPPRGREIEPRKAMKHTHHLLARLLAEGRKEGECAQIVGYAGATISILKQDPAFQELLEYYRAQNEVIYSDIHTRLANLGQDAVEELQQRIATAPEDFGNKSLMDLVELTLDRSVAPPKGKGESSAPQASPPQFNIHFHSPELGKDSKLMIDVTETPP